MKLTSDNVDGFVRQAEKLESRSMKYADSLNDDEKRRAAHIFETLNLALNDFLRDVRRWPANDELPKDWTA